MVVVVKAVQRGRDDDRPASKMDCRNHADSAYRGANDVDTSSTLEAVCFFKDFLRRVSEEDSFEVVRGGMLTVVGENF